MERGEVMCECRCVITHKSYFFSCCFFFNDTATTEIYTLSLHDALPISYLIWLGIRMWRSSSESMELSAKTDNKVWHAILANAFVITALNPKSIVFFLAFLPQFINSEKPFITQSLILGSTFLVLAIISVLFYSMLASFTGQQMQLSLIHRWTNRIGGSLLIGAGGITAFN